MTILWSLRRNAVVHDAARIAGVSGGANRLARIRLSRPGLVPKTRMSSVVKALCRGSRYAGIAVSRLMPS